MDEVLARARDELKRVDHLIYVSLKYTRTVDILKNIIERLIECYSIIIVGLLEKAKEEKKIFEVPAAPLMQCSNLKEVYKDQEVINLADFYLFLRKINRSRFDRINEYRRHVGMIAHLEDENRDVEVNIDKVTEYYKLTQKYMELIEERYK